MIQNVLTEMGGISLYGMISTCLFCTVFGAVLIRALLLRKPFLESMASLPLREDEPPARAAENVPSPSEADPAAKPGALGPRRKGPETL